MPLLGGFAAVGRHRSAFGGAHADREDRDPPPAEPGQRGPDIALGALTVGDQEHRLVAHLSLVLERHGRGAESAREIGGRIGEVIGAGGIEESLERGVIRGERELEKGAATEDDQAEPVFG